MSEPYETVNWKNYPIRTTPITAENLNHMDNQIKNNSDTIQSAAMLPVIDGKICVLVQEEE